VTDVVLVERRGDDAALLLINRPKALNALNPAVIDALGDALERLAAEGVRHLVLSGAGPKSFVAGADIAAMQSLSVEEATGFAKHGQRVLDRFAAFPGVTIAAVNGFALGGGMELAMACDLILADERAKFGQPEVTLGVIPGFGGTQRLVRLVGLQRARELVLTGRMVGAEEAVRIGIALELVARPEPAHEGDRPASVVVERAFEIVKQVAAQGPVAVDYAKRALQTAQDGTLREGLDAEADLFGRCFATSDQTEGMAAFLGRRPAVFTGA
jgi:enoyl-CoA hydratase